MAEKTVQLEIVTPEKAVVSEAARIVMAPAELGEFGVLPGHTPFMANLKMGVVRFVDQEGKERMVFVNGGFAEALPDRVTILTEAAERRRDIDIERVRASLARAEKRLASEDQEGVDFTRARASLARAMLRIRLVEPSSD